MSTIPNNFGTTLLRTVDKMHSSLLQFIFVLCILCASVVNISAQYTTNGYIFLHPFFSNGSWAASTFTSAITVADPITENKPRQITFSRNTTEGSVVFTTNDASWYITTAPLVSSTCICCKPEIFFADPVKILVPPALMLSASVPFHIVSPASPITDTTYLVGASANRVFCLHVNTSIGSIATVDTLDLPHITSQTITGVWGESTSAGTDQSIWITGTGGLLIRIPVTGTRFGTAATYNLPIAETVTCYGDNLAGTSSGKLYQKESSAFVAIGQTSGAALRSVKSQVAVGDDGSVLVLRNGSWQSFTKGTSDYRAATLTSAASGAAIELVDNGWNYSSYALDNSPTRIASVQPEAVAIGLNKGTYGFSGANPNITVTLTDNEGNHSLPVIHSIRGTDKSLLADSMSLLRRYDLAICTTTAQQLSDTTIKITLSSGSIILEAPARRGQFDLSCQFWKWQQSTFRKTVSWTTGDTLQVESSTDILKIYNKTPAVTSQQIPDVRKLTTGITINPVNRNQLSFTMASPQTVSSFLICNAAGKTVWKKADCSRWSTSIVTPPLPRGILFIRIINSDGTIHFRQILLRQN